MMKASNHEKEIQVKDLDIPAGFQWKLTQVSETTVSSTIPTPTIVSFFLDEACSEEEKLATIPVYAETSSLPLSIPTYAKHCMLNIKMVQVL